MVVRSLRNVGYTQSTGDSCHGGSGSEAPAQPSERRKQTASLRYDSVSMASLLNEAWNTHPNRCAFSAFHLPAFVVTFVAALAF